MYKCVLIVEDEKTIADMYITVLRKAGYEVTAEGDGQKGYELARSGKYDLVLLDIMLPSLTGIEILSRLRNKKLSPKFTDKHHIIILTNIDEDDVTKKKINKLAQGYYLKVDITPHRLSDIIKSLSASKELNDD